MSLACAAQGASSVHPKLAPLVTVVGHTHTPAVGEWNKAQGLWGFYKTVRYHRVVAKLKPGQLLVGATAEVFKTEAQVVNIRDSILWTAGRPGGREGDRNRRALDGWRCWGALARLQAVGGFQYPLERKLDGYIVSAGYRPNPSRSQRLPVIG